MGVNKQEKEQSDNKTMVKIDLIENQFPQVSAGKKSKKNRKRSKKRKVSKKARRNRKLRKGRKERNGKTVAQIVLLTLNAASSNKLGTTFVQIYKCLNAAKIHISKFVLKKVLSKMIKLKVVKKVTNNRYSATGKKLPRKNTIVRNKATKATSKKDAKMRKLLK